MEGRFLDVVLRGVPNVLLVHLTASWDELLSKNGGGRGASGVPAGMAGPTVASFFTGDREEKEAPSS